MKRAFAALLASTMILSLFACSNKQNTVSQSSTAQTEAESSSESDFVSSLPQKDFEGREFTVLTRTVSGWPDSYIPYDIEADKICGEPINDAVYARNLALDESYGIKITELRREITDGTFDSALRGAVLSGDGTIDACTVMPSGANEYIGGGFLCNMLNFDYIDWDNGCWDESANNSLIYKNTLFYAFGDVLLQDDSAVNVILFNKTLAENCGAGDIYSYVKSGGWTMDKMYALMKLGARDVDGDGNMTPEKDIYGFLAQMNIMLSFYTSSGSRFAEVKNDSEIAFTFDCERTYNVYEKIFKILYDDNLTINAHKSYGTTIDKNAMFCNGLGMFFWDCLSVVSGFRATDVDFGIIPLPKYDDVQENYYSSIDNYGACCIAVPCGADPDFSAFTLEAMAEGGHEKLIPAYYDTLLENKVARDEESAEMLDIIFDSTVVDIGIFYNFGDFSNQIMIMSVSNNENISSNYKACEKAITTKLEKFSEDLDNIIESTKGRSNRMKYEPKKFHMWDAWCINTGDELHLFHLQFPRKDSGIKIPEEWGWGHAVSRDLVHWEEKPQVLCPHGLPHDSEIKFTGSTVYKDGQYYMFYVMRDGAYQRIGLATSSDLYDWHEYENNPVLIPDKRWFITYADGKDRENNYPAWEPNVDCRDMLVTAVPGGGFYGYFVVAADMGGTSPTGVIGVAHSDDLINWDQMGIAYASDRINIVEMIDIFQLNGRWYMTLLTSSAYGSRHNFSDENVCRGEIYASSDTPLGPFLENQNDNTFIGGPDDTGYSCRTVDFRGEKRLIYIDTNRGEGVLTLPKTVRENSGKLRPYYAADLLACIRKQQLCSKVTLQPQNSFAWPSHGGVWINNNDDTISCKTDPKSWQAGLFEDGNRCDNIEIEGVFEWRCGSKDSAFGFVFWSGRNFPHGKKLAVVIEPEKNRVHLAEPYAWQLRDFRSYEFSDIKSAHLRVILADNTCELYINDELVLNCGCDNPHENIPGVFADDGTITVKEVAVYEIGID